MWHTGLQKETAKPVRNVQTENGGKGESYEKGSVVLKSELTPSFIIHTLLAAVVHVVNREWFQTATVSLAMRSGRILIDF